MKLYWTPKFEFGRVEFASGGPGGPLVSKVDVEPCMTYHSTCNYVLWVKDQFYYGK